MSMKDYQRQKNNKYILPSAVWNQTIWAIRDYGRLQSEADSILLSTPEVSVAKSSCKNISDEVSSLAAKRESMLNRIRLIDNALLEIPSEYRQGVWLNVLIRSPYPDDAARQTYSRYKAKFICHVAEALNII